MEQIKKIAKNLNRYFGVVKFINIIATVIASIFFIYILFIYDSTQLTNLLSVVSIDWLTIEFSESIFNSQTNVKIHLIIQLISTYISVLLFLKLITVIRNILNTMVEETVFKESMASHIMELSALCFIYGVFTNVIGFIDYRFMIDHSNLITLLEIEKIVDITISYTFDYDFIILSAVIYLLSYIFKHGAQLQQLSDETL